MDEYSNQDPAATQVTCLQCGYNLTGTVVGGRCPECGTPVVPAFQAGSAPTSGKAIASMVLGICSIPTCLCYGVPALICGALAISFWSQAQAQITTGQRGGASEGMAKAGLICGIVGVVLGLCYIGLIAVAIVVSSY